MAAAEAAAVDRAGLRAVRGPRAARAHREARSDARRLRSAARGAGLRSAPRRQRAGTPARVREAARRPVAPRQARLRRQRGRRGDRPRPSRGDSAARGSRIPRARRRVACATREAMVVDRARRPPRLDGAARPPAARHMASRRRRGKPRGARRASAAFVRRVRRARPSRHRFRVARRRCAPRGRGREPHCGAPACLGERRRSRGRTRGDGGAREVLRRQVLRDEEGGGHAEVPSDGDANRRRRARSSARCDAPRARRRAAPRDRPRRAGPHRARHVGPPCAARRVARRGALRERRTVHRALRRQHARHRPRSRRPRPRCASGRSGGARRARRGLRAREQGRAPLSDEVLHPSSARRAPLLRQAVGLHRDAAGLVVRTRRHPRRRLGCDARCGVDRPLPRDPRGVQPPAGQARTHRRGAPLLEVFAVPRALAREEPTIVEEAMS